MLKLNAKFDADLLLYLLGHFECDNHTVHMLTPRHLPPSLTSTVKSSLFTHVHPSPLSLTARLHWCHTNYSCFINMARLFLDRTHAWKTHFFKFWGLSCKAYEVSSRNCLNIWPEKPHAMPPRMPQWSCLSPELKGSSREESTPACARSWGGRLTTGHVWIWAPSCPGGW